MPMYDRVCDNGHELIDCWEPIGAPDVACPSCAAPTKRVWLGKTCAIIPDDIPGGVWVRHGICNDDGTPRKYYTKSEMVKEAKARGLVNLVEHTTDPTSGSDKAKHTTRWV